MLSFVAQRGPRGAFDAAPSTRRLRRGGFDVAASTWRLRRGGFDAAQPVRALDARYSLEIPLVFRQPLGARTGSGARPGAGCGASRPDALRLDRLDLPWRSWVARPR
jgi:hypothetical protein